MSVASVVVVGSFMMDLAVRAARRPEAGETVIGTDFEMFLGGKGFNQAIAAARAGAATAMIGHLGTDDFGARFARQLAADGIDTAHVHRHPDVGTGIGLPLVEDSGENSIVVVPRANECLRPHHVREAADVIAGAAVLLVQLELPVETTVEAARIARSAGVPVVCNPAPAPVGLGPLTGLVDVLVPNRIEAGRLTGSPATAAADVVARRLREATGAAVVLTLGGAGVLVLDGDEPHHLAAHVVEVVDTVGAGDAFCGTLAAALAAGLDLRAAAVGANAAGALAVTRAGAEPSMPSAPAVAALLAGGNGAPRPAEDGSLAVGPAHATNEIHP